jgi:prefoldin subunit 5
MTTSPEQLERKVRQLDNDVQSIYELLTTIQATQQRMGNRLDGHDARFDAIDARFDAMGQRFDAMDQRFDEVLRVLRER